MGKKSKIEEPVVLPFYDGEDEMAEIGTEEPAAKHIVVKGDTLDSISYEHYGTRKRAKDIAKANNLATRFLRLGMELKLPE